MVALYFSQQNKRFNTVAYRCVKSRKIVNCIWVNLKNGNIHTSQHCPFAHGCFLLNLMKTTFKKVSLGRKPLDGLRMLGWPHLWSISGGV